MSFQFKKCQVLDVKNTKDRFIAWIEGCNGTQLKLREFRRGDWLTHDTKSKTIGGGVA